MVVFYKYSNLNHNILTNEFMNNLSRVIICVVITSWLQCGINSACSLILHEF